MGSPRANESADDWVSDKGLKQSEIQSLRSLLEPKQSQQQGISKKDRKTRGSFEDYGRETTEDKSHDCSNNWHIASVVDLNNETAFALTLFNKL